jgi:hypothetical protein
MNKFYLKIKNRIWYNIVSFTRNKSIYLFLYRSYWNYLFHQNNGSINNINFYTSRPNPGAGIGHQIANWIAGYWFSIEFGLNYAHSPFSSQKWDNFLGFGVNELNISKLQKMSYKKVRLPLFDEFNIEEVELQKRIIHSYKNKKVVFVSEQDQGYKDQFGVSGIIKFKFNNAPSRINDVLIYDRNNFNIAIHVRRTVIIDNKVIFEDDAAKSMRWLSNDYYENVLNQVVQNLKLKRPISIYIFSTSKAYEFNEFSKYGDIHFCTDMDEYSSFLHLINADLLITSKSSFSYKPALMNNSFKICPRNFWHSYPTDNQWIMAENDGCFDISLLNQII